MLSLFKLIANLRLVSTLLFFFAAVMSYRYSFKELGEAQPMLPAVLFIMSVLIASYSYWRAEKED